MSLLGAAVLGYAGFCAALWWFQDFLIYEGAAVVPESVALKRAEAEGKIAVRDGVGRLIGYESKAKPEPCRGTAVIFHGKGGNALSRKFFTPALEKRGLRVIMYEYPGYEGREGHANERHIVDEARALIRRLDKEGKGPIYLWGESLGTGAVGSVAADPTLPIRGIVLITPFDSLENIAASRYPLVPVPYLIRDRYETYVNLANLRVPIVLVQAANDRSVPAWSTDHLFESLNGPKLRIVLPNCGHNDWPRGVEEKWWDEALDFVGK